MLFPLERYCSKNEEYFKYFLIFSAKLKSKEREMGKNGMKLQENYRVMGNVQHITRFLKGMDKTCPHANGEWQDHPYVLNSGDTILN